MIGPSNPISASKVQFCTELYYYCKQVLLNFFFFTAVTHFVDIDDGPHHTPECLVAARLHQQATCSGLRVGRRR